VEENGGGSNIEKPSTEETPGGRTFWSQKRGIGKTSRHGYKLVQGSGQGGVQKREGRKLTGRDRLESLEAGPEIHHGKKEVSGPPSVKRKNKLASRGRGHYIINYVREPIVITKDTSVQALWQ